MANHKSAIIQWRHSLRRNAVNRRNKSILHTHIKKIRTEINNKNIEEAKKLLPVTFSVIDKTVKKGAIHKNKGNRYKSRLSHQIKLFNSSK